MMQRMVNDNLGAVFSSGGVSPIAPFLSPRRGRVEQSTEVGELAAIQRRFLPWHVSTFKNVHCSALCRQAEEVGGDFYDLVHLQNGHLGIAIGDVSGKGVGAALMMASLQATLRAEVTHRAGNLAALIEAANRLFYEASLEHLYSTLFYATLDPATRVMAYVNAGHFPPMIVRRADAGIKWLDLGGPPIGIFPQSHYEVGSIALDPCDLVVAYTDGVVESRNSSSEHWGVERLVRIVQKTRHRAPIKLIAEIVEAVDTFSSGAEPHDDMALVVLRAD
jgi:sigma-B regulation protein RsbU (phosphoserine phosphatase)